MELKKCMEGLSEVFRRAFDKMRCGTKESKMKNYEVEPSHEVINVGSPMKETPCKDLDEELICCQNAEEKSMIHDGTNTTKDDEEEFVIRKRFLYLAHRDTPETSPVTEYLAEKHYVGLPNIFAFPERNEKQRRRQNKQSARKHLGFNLKKN